ncbi:hypothetical protein HY346_00060 [Candidatus Microgenomates bacterium]|nr:hypothetical protein [Candidatus Microgenomates bacterium]
MSLEVTSAPGFIQVQSTELTLWAGGYGLFMGLPNQNLHRVEFGRNQVVVTFTGAIADNLYAGRWQQLISGLSLAQHGRRYPGLVRPNRRSPAGWGYVDTTGAVYGRLAKNNQLLITWQPPIQSLRSVWRQASAKAESIFLDWYWQQVWLVDNQWQDPRVIIDLLEVGEAYFQGWFRIAGYRWLAQQLQTDWQSGSAAGARPRETELAQAQSLGQAISRTALAAARRAWWLAHPEVLTKLADAKVLPAAIKNAWADQPSRSVNIHWFENWLSLQPRPSSTKLPMSLAESLCWMKKLIQN